MGEDKPYGLSSILNGPWADKSSKLFERNPVIGSVTSGGPRLPFIPGVSVEYSVLNDLSSSGVLPPQLGPSLPSRTSTPRQSPRSKYWDDVQARSFGRPNTAPAPYGEWVPSSAFVRGRSISGPSSYALGGSSGSGLWGGGAELRSRGSPRNGRTRAPRVLRTATTETVPEIITAYTHHRPPTQSDGSRAHRRLEPVFRPGPSGDLGGEEAPREEVSKPRKESSRTRLASGTKALGMGRNNSSFENLPQGTPGRSSNKPMGREVDPMTSQMGELLRGEGIAKSSIDSAMAALLEQRVAHPANALAALVATGIKGSELVAAVAAIKDGGRGAAEAHGFISPATLPPLREPTPPELVRSLLKEVQGLTAEQAAAAEPLVAATGIPVEQLPALKLEGEGLVRALSAVAALEVRASCLWHLDTCGEALPPLLEQLAALGGLRGEALEQAVECGHMMWLPGDQIAEAIRLLVGPLKVQTGVAASGDCPQAAPAGAPATPAKEAPSGVPGTAVIKSATSAAAAAKFHGFEEPSAGAAPLTSVSVALKTMLEGGVRGEDVLATLNTLVVAESPSGDITVASLSSLQHIGCARAKAQVLAAAREAVLRPKGLKAVGLVDFPEVLQLIVDSGARGLHVARVLSLLQSVKVQGHDDWAAGVSRALHSMAGAGLRSEDIHAMFWIALDMGVAGPQLAPALEILRKMGVRVESAGAAPSFLEVFSTFLALEVPGGDFADVLEAIYSAGGRAEDLGRILEKMQKAGGGGEAGAAGDDKSRAWLPGRSAAAVLTTLQGAGVSSGGVVDIMSLLQEIEIAPTRVKEVLLWLCGAGARGDEVLACLVKLRGLGATASDIFLACRAIFLACHDAGGAINAAQVLGAIEGLDVREAGVGSLLQALEGCCVAGASVGTVLEDLLGPMGVRGMSAVSAVQALDAARVQGDDAVRCLQVLQRAGVEGAAVATALDALRDAGARGGEVLASFEALARAPVGGADIAHALTILVGAMRTPSVLAVLQQMEALRMPGAQWMEVLVRQDRLGVRGKGVGLALSHLADLRLAGPDVGPVLAALEELVGQEDSSKALEEKLVWMTKQASLQGGAVLAMLQKKIAGLQAKRPAVDEKDQARLDQMLRAAEVEAAGPLHTDLFAAMDGCRVWGGSMQIQVVEQLTRRMGLEGQGLVDTMAAISGSGLQGVAVPEVLGDLIGASVVGPLVKGTFRGLAGCDVRGAALKRVVACLVGPAHFEADAMLRPLEAMARVGLTGALCDAGVDLIAEVKQLKERVVGNAFSKDSFMTTVEDLEKCGATGPAAITVMRALRASTLRGKSVDAIMAKVRAAKGAGVSGAAVFSRLQLARAGRSLSAALEIMIEVGLDRAQMAQVLASLAAAGIHEEPLAEVLMLVRELGIRAHHALAALQALAQLTKCGMTGADLIKLLQAMVLNWSIRGESSLALLDMANHLGGSGATKAAVLDGLAAAGLNGDAVLTLMSKMDGAYVDMSAAGGFWVLAAYGERGVIPGWLNRRGGEYDPALRRGSATLDCSDLLSEATEVAYSWSYGGLPDGGIQSYDCALRHQLRPRLTGAMPAVGSMAGDYQRVKCTWVKNPGNMPDRWSTRAATLGVAFGRGYGLVDNSRVAHSPPDWCIDSQRLSAIYLGVAGAAGGAPQAGVVVNGKHRAPATMAMWLRVPPPAPAEKSAPPPTILWDFRSTTSGSGSSVMGKLHGKAYLRESCLVLNSEAGGANYMSTDNIPFTVTDKTMVVWARVSDLDQSTGGSIMTVQAPFGRLHSDFDAICYGHLGPRKWHTGSNSNQRTKFDISMHAEEADSEWVCLALVHENKGGACHSKLYRNGKEYGRSFVKGMLPTYTASNYHVAFGVRHHWEGRPMGLFQGVLGWAGLWDRALTADQVMDVVHQRPLLPETPPGFENNAEKAEKA